MADSDSDWAITDNEKPVVQELNPDEWGLSPEKNKSPTATASKESPGYSAAIAPFRMAADLYNKTVQGVGALPDYYQKAKTEIPGVANVLMQHPLHALSQFGGGLMEAGQGMGNIPGSVANYLTNRLHLMSPEVNSLISGLSSLNPNMQRAQSHLDQLGQPQYPGEAAIRGAGRNLLPIAGVSELMHAMPHLTKGGATKALNQARDMAQERDIGSLNVNPELINDAKQFLPNTLPYRNALENAHYGDYNSLFGLQSDVGKNAGDYAGSRFSAAERAHGRAGLDARNRLLDAIHENLQSQGHNDISDLLRQGQNDYRRYMAFKPWRNKLLGWGTGAAGVGMLLPHNSISDLARKILAYAS